MSSAPELRDDARLLRGARETLWEFGYEGATMERIARAAGLSRVTLHRRGISKEQILEALVADAEDDYRAALRPALLADGSARQRLELALVALCEVAEANLELLLAVGRYSDRVFHEHGREALTRTPFTQPLEQLLRAGSKDGTLRAAKPRETATVLFNVVGWSYIHLRAGHGWNAARARRATIELAINGVAA